MAAKPSIAVPLTVKLRANSAKKVTRRGGESHYVVTTTLAELCLALFRIDHDVAAFLQAQVAATPVMKKKIGFDCPTENRQG